MINIDALNDDEKLAALESIHKSIEKSKEIQKKKITTNVELIVKALKKIESDFKQRYDETGKLISNLKSGEDGRDGKDGKDGKNGKDGRDGLMGPRGYDGVPGRNGLDGADGVSVTDAHIDFDGSLIIHLSSGRVINVGEVVTPDIAEKIKVITNGGGTSQGVLDAIASLQAQIDAIASGLEYQGTWNASTNVPTLASSVGTAGYYYIVATAGSTNLNGVTDWQVGDWAVFNGTVWQKIDQTNLVTSVAGRTGAIVLTTTDIGGLGTIATQAANNVSITGGSITGITDLAIADGGTGQSTAAAAITALTGTQTTGFYLRSNGTNAVLSAIIAGDVPTLNQSTTGSAGSLSTTLVTSSGGTGLTSFTNKGVLYASSTSTLATGTALQFDGTNFAVGTTPSAFGSTFRAVEVGDLASLAFESSGVTKKTYLSTNSYNATNTGARPYYKANGLATEYSQNVGEHAWFTAPTGIAGSSTTITTGKIYTNLTVGNQTDFGASSNAIGTIWTATSSGTLSSGTVVQNIDFVESMRIDASSNVGIGMSAPGSKLDVKGTLRLSGSTSGYVGLAPAAAAGSTTYTLPSADGTNGQSLTTNGSGTLSWASGTGGTVTSVAMTVPSFLSVSGSPITSSGTLAVSLSGTALPIANGGTGQTTANAAFNALVPSQTGNSGKYLTTNGTDTSWATNPLGTVTSVGGTGTVNGLTLTGTVTTSGNLTLGGTLDLSSPPAIGNTAANTGAFTTLSASSTVTLSGGTANGVAYLNGSKVVTSGSALTFDGTAFGITGTTSSIRSILTATTGAPYSQFTNTGSSFFVGKENSAGGSFGTTAYASVLYEGGNFPMVFFTNAAEQMRLTSTGLGIGTSSPQGTYKLTISGTDSVFPAVYLDNTTNSKAYSMRVTGTSWIIRDNTAGTDRLNLDTSGNLTLSAGAITSKGSNISDQNIASYGFWTSIQENGFFDAGGNFLHNATKTSGVNDTFVYRNTGLATRYKQLNSVHSWYTAPSGTAGNAITFTQAMTLDASGRLGIGITSPTTVIDAQDASSATRITLTNTANAAAGAGVNFIVKNGATTVGNSTIRVDNADNLQFFNIGGERARIDSSGNFFVGRTSLSLGNTGAVISSGGIITSEASFTGTNEIAVFNQISTGTSQIDFRYQAVASGYIEWNSTATLYITTSDYRLKNTIAPITGALAKVALLKPCTYKWNANGSDGQGFIAHELAEVCPQAVSGEKDAVDAKGNPKYQGIDTSFLVATLTAAIQEQQAIINQLKARLDAANL